MSLSDLEGCPCPQGVVCANVAAMALCVLGTDLPHTLPPLAEAAFYLLQPRKQLPRGFLKQAFSMKWANYASGITELPDYSLVLSYSDQGARLVRKADRNNKVDEHGVVAVTSTRPFPGHSAETLYLPDVKVLINCSTTAKQLVAYRVDFSEEEEDGGSGPPPRFSKLWSTSAHKPGSLCRLGGTLSSSPFLAVSSAAMERRLDVFKLDLQSLSTPPKEYPVKSGAYYRVSAIPGTESSLLFTTASSTIERMDIHINKDSDAISGCTIHRCPIASGDSYYGICCVDREWAMASTGQKLKRFRHYYSLRGQRGGGVTNEMSDIVHRKKTKVNSDTPSSRPSDEETQEEETTDIRSRVVFVSDVSGDALIGSLDGQFFVYE